MIANQGWLADAALINRVIARCPGEGTRNYLRNVKNLSRSPYEVNLPDTGETMGFEVQLGFNVAQYRPRTLELLDEKIRQFPAGTTFVMGPIVDNDSFDGQKLEATVRELFRRRGMILKGPEENRRIPHPSADQGLPDAH